MANNLTTTIVLKVSGKQAENSFAGLNKLTRSLEKELKKLTPGTEAFMKKAAELKEAREHFNKVKKEIDAVNGKLEKTPNLLNRITNGLLDFGNVAKNLVTVNLLDFLGGNITGAADNLLKISDAMADVQKTTGMALEEVKALWDAFDEMDTRTSKLDRLKIAEVAGRLGVPKEQLKDFVQEVDKAYVALGDSFEGGLEGVVDSLGKIKGLFEDTKSKSYATAINEVGSALNELAANGTASEGNISDFTLRVGALGDAIKPAIDKVLGLGAAFEESGIDSQIAASGFSNFMKVAGENLDQFAYSMNISLAEAKKLFNEKPEEFFLKFAEGMRGVEADKFLNILGSLGIKSGEVQRVIGAAANNTDKFRDAMDLAGKSMQEATSLTDEFNKKNNNAAAIWEKIKNVISDTFSSTNLINTFESLIFMMGNFMGVTNEAAGSVHNLRARFDAIVDITKALIAGFLGYQAVVAQSALLEGNYTRAKWLSIVADKAQALATSIKSTAMGIYNGVLQILKLRTDSATASTIALNTATKLSPWGVLIGLITAAATAYALLSDNVDELSEGEKRLADATQNAVAEQSKEISTLERLYKAATDASQGKDAQREAVEKLQNLYPSYFGNMSEELIMLGKAEGKYRDLREAILASARARAAQQIIDENEKESLVEEVEVKRQIKKLEAEKQVFKKNPKKTEFVDRSSKNFWGGTIHTEERSNEDAIKVREKSIKELEQRLKTTQDNRKKQNAEYLKIVEEDTKKSADFEKDKKERNTTIGTQNIVANGTGKPSKPTRPNRPAKTTDSSKEVDKAQQEQKKLQKELIQAERILQDEKFKIMEESEKKAKEIEIERHKRKKEDLQSKNTEILSEIQANENKISELRQRQKNTQNPTEKAYYQKSIETLEKNNQDRRSLIQKNNDLEKELERAHQQNLINIENEYKEKAYRQFVAQKQDEIQKAILEEEEKIQKIGTLEEAKLKLKDLHHLKLTETELRNIKTLEDAKKALREEAHRKVLEQQLEFIEEEQKQLNKLMKDPALSKEAREKLKKDLQELDFLLSRLRGERQGSKERDSANAENERNEKLKNVDILGISAHEWKETFNNLDTTEGKIKGIAVATKGLSNAFNQFAKLQNALNERELRRFTRNQNHKKKELLKQLNRGLITQEQYHKGVEKIEEESAEKKRKLQRRAAIAEKAANIMSAISGTALAVVNALHSAPPPANFALAGIVGALGAVQIATIAAQPIPEFAEGGFTGNGVGKADRTGFKPAGIVHEKEYVTPKWMLESPVIADVVDWMESIRTGKTELPKTYAQGGLVTASLTQNKPNTTDALPNTNDPQLVFVLSELKDLLGDLKENGIDAYMVEDAENGKRIKRTINLFEKIERKNARKNI